MAVTCLGMPWVDGPLPQAPLRVASNVKETGVRSGSSSSADQSWNTSDGAASDREPTGPPPPTNSSPTSPQRRPRLSVRAMEAAVQSDEDQHTDPIINRNREYKAGQEGPARMRSHAILGSTGDESSGDHDMAGSTASGAGPSSPTTSDDGLIVDPIVAPHRKRVSHEQALPSEGNRSCIATVPVPPTKFIRTT